MKRRGPEAFGSAEEYDLYVKGRCCWGLDSPILGTGTRLCGEPSDRKSEMGYCAEHQSQAGGWRWRP